MESTITNIFTKPDPPVFEEESTPYVETDIRYYIPSINEWYVGFEYEQRRELWDPYDPGVKVLEYIWEPVIGSLSSETGGLHQFMEGIDSKRQSKHYRFTGSQLGWGAYSNIVRVKYLDREDIESLGWVYKSNTYDERDASGKLVKQTRSGYFKEDWYLSYYNESFQHVIMIRETEELSEYPAMRFLGTIKNKSELKILMKQLGIDGNTK